MKDKFGMKLKKHLEWKTFFLEYDTKCAQMGYKGGGGIMGITRPILSK